MVPKNTGMSEFGIIFTGLIYYILNNVNPDYSEHVICYNKE